MEGGEREINPSAVEVADVIAKERSKRTRTNGVLLIDHPHLLSTSNNLLSYILYSDLYFPHQIRRVQGRKYF